MPADIYLPVRHIERLTLFDEILRANPGLFAYLVWKPAATAGC